MMIIGLICAFGLSEFIGELAITESDRFQGAILAAGLRLFAVFTTGLFVTTSMIREFNDKGFELVLSQPIPRAAYYSGKLTGFAMLSVVIACLVTLPLILYASSGQVLIWCASLICELFIVTAMGLLCLFTFSNITIAFSVVVAFYLLSRCMDAIQLISNSPILETDSFAQELINKIIDVIAYLLPDLNLFTQTQWLIYGNGDLNSLGSVMGQTVIYVVFLSGAALFDLYRKEL
jgi:ABC-type transport system involved in multi-copper enzyme maturation permease subunit